MFTLGANPKAVNPIALTNFESVQCIWSNSVVPVLNVSQLTNLSVNDGPLVNTLIINNSMWDSVG